MIFNNLAIIAPNGPTPLVRSTCMSQMAINLSHLSVFLLHWRLISLRDRL